MPDLVGGPGTLALEQVIVGNPALSTVTATAAKSGNDFTVTVSGSNSGGSGSGTFTMKLASTTYTRYQLTSFSPKFITLNAPMSFETSSSVSGTGTGGGFRFRVERCDTVDTLSTASANCVLAQNATTQLPIVSVNGKWVIQVRTQISYLGGVAVDAYYSFLPPAPPPGPTATQDLRSFSGPFWEHRVTLSNVPNGCTMTVNGTALRFGTRFAISNRTASIQYRFTCAASASSFGQFAMDGDVELTGLDPATPVLTYPSAGIMLIATPPMPSVATLSGNINVTNTPAQVTGWEVETRVLHGHVPRPSAPINVDICKNQTDRTVRTVGTPASIRFSAPCANEFLFRDSSSTPHGFADGRDIAKITTQAVVFASARTATALTPIGSFTLLIDSIYKTALPKIGLEPARLQLTALQGDTASQPGSIRISNVGGGLLDWTGGGSGSGPIAGINLDPPFGTPSASTGLKAGDSVTVQATAFAPNGFPASGTVTGRIDIRSANASNSSPAPFIPYEVTIGGAAVPDEVSLSDVFPAPGQNLEADTINRLSANVRYQLGSKDQGTLRLEVVDATLDPIVAIPLAASDALNLNRGSSGTVPLFVSVTIPNGTTLVRLAAVLRDPSGAVIRRSSPVEYRIAPKLELTVLGSFPAAPGPLAPGTSATIRPAVRYSLGNLTYGVIEFETKVRSNNLEEVTKQHFFVGTDASKRGPNFNPNTAGSATMSLQTFVPSGDASSPTRVSVSIVLRQDAGGPELLRAPPLEYDTAEPEIRIEEITGLDGTPAPAVLSADGSYQFMVKVRFSGVLTGSQLKIVASPEGEVNGTWPTISGNGQSVLIVDVLTPAAPEEFLYLAAQIELPGEQIVRSADREFRLIFLQIRKLRVLQQFAPPRTNQISRQHPARFELELVYANPADVPLRLACENRVFSPTPGGRPGAGVFTFQAEQEFEPVPPKTLPKSSIVTLDGAPHFKDAAIVLVRCELIPSDQDSVPAQAILTDFFTPTTLASGAKVDAGPLTLDRIFTDVSHATNISQQQRHLTASLSTPTKPDGSRQSALRLPAAIGSNEFIAATTTWQLDPPPPAASRFSAELTIHYAGLQPSPIPGTPESELKILSVNSATGTVEPLRTFVDAALQTATAQIQGGSQFFSLGYVAPFRHQNLDSVLPAEPVYLNTGTTPVNVTVSRNTTPPSAPASIAIPPGALLSRPVSPELDALTNNSARWLHAAGDSAALRGLSLLNDLRGLDTLPHATQPAISWILTGLEATQRGTSELHLSNSDAVPASVTVQLFASSGLPAGSRDLQLDTKQRSSLPVDRLLSLPKPFTGYAVVTSTQPINAAVLWNAFGSIAALPAQPVDNSATPRLYSAPLLAGGQADTRLNLVNPASRPVNYSVRAFLENGTQAGQTLNGRLEQGQQLWATAAANLGDEVRQIATGSLLIETDGPIAGDVSLTGTLARSDLRLAEPKQGWIIPYIPGPTAAISIHNPGAAPASVRIRVTTASGAPAGTVTVNVAPRARLSQILAALIPASATVKEAWIAVDADQPVTAFALFGSLDADIATVDGQPAAATPVGPAPAPVLTLSPASLAFGTTTIGQPKDLPLTISNSGNAPLTVSAGPIANPRFTVATPASGLTIAAGAQQTLTVRFTPTAAGNETASLVLTTNDPAKPSTSVPLTGTGQAPLPPANFAGQWTTDYGTLTITQTGANVTGVYPSSSGTLTGTVNGNVLTGTWNQPGTSGTLSFTLSADGNRFTGSWNRTTGSGPSSGTWNGTRAVTPTAPVISVSPSSLDFGPVAPGQPRTLPLLVRNTGTAVLQVTAISNSARFTITPFNFSLNPGAEQTISVIFRPEASGPLSAAITITSNDPARPSVSVAITGTGQPAAPPANFGGQWNTTYGVMTITQTGTSVTAVYPSYSGTISGSVNGDVMSGTWNEPGTSGNFSFTLSADGNRFTGSWTRTTGSGAGSGSWTGTRVAAPTAPVISVSPASLDFGPVAAGQTRTLPVSIRNTGSNTLQGTAASNSARFTLAPATFSVNAGAEQVLNLTFRPDAAGALSAVLTINSNDTARPTVSVALSGTGTAVTPAATVLQIDDGTFERKVGAPGGIVYFLNRLTPTRYPATLRAVRIYFHAESDALPQGTPINVISAANPGGSANINPPNTQLRSTASTVGQPGRFTDFPVTPITISSGDFVVGFAANNPPGILPLGNDTSTPFAGRSYLGLDANEFFLMNTIPGLTPGNLLIRAVLE